MSEQQHYYNTNGLSGESLLDANEKALCLQDKILELYKRLPDDKTPFEISTIMVKNGYKYPITSIRRAMTNLSKEGKLIKSPSANRYGDYAKPNHTWKLSELGKDGDKIDGIFPNIL